MKLKFVLEPKKLLQKWLECEKKKKNVFTVKISLIAPTLGGPAGPAGPPNVGQGPLKRTCNDVQ